MGKQQLMRYRGERGGEGWLVLRTLLIWVVERCFSKSRFMCFKEFCFKKRAVRADGVNKVGQCLECGAGIPRHWFCILTVVHLSSRAEHVKENGLTYPSPGIANGIKLSPQETRPSSPAALPSAGEKVKELLLLRCCLWGSKGKGGQTGDAGMLHSVASLAGEMTQNAAGVLQ